MIKPDSRFFDDLAKVATGAVGALSGVRGQIRQEIRSQINKFIVEMDFVPREDFEIVEAMVREARLQNQRLEARLANLEEHFGLNVKPTTATKAASKAKATPKKQVTKTKVSQTKASQTKISQTKIRKTKA